MSSSSAAIARLLRRLAPLHWMLLFVVAELVLLTVVRLTAAAPDGGDLCRDYIDARRLLAGQPVYVPFSACGTLHHSPHPPLNLLLLLPFTLLPVGVAAWLWDVLMLVALVTALALLAQELHSAGDERWWQIGLLALAVWPPLLDTWLEAQIGPVILLALVLAWRARRQDHPWATGAWLAVATLLRLYPVLLFAYPLLRREWRVAGGGIVAGAGMTLVSLIFVHPADYIAYLTREAPGATAEWVNDSHNVSLRGWLGDIFIGNNTIYPIFAKPEFITPCYVLGIVVIGALLARQAWQARLARRGSEADDLAWLIMIPATLLLSPLTWPHYFIILLLPGMVAWSWWQGRPEMARQRIWLLTSAALLYVQAIGLQILFPLPRILAWPAGIFVFALPAYGLVLTCAALWHSNPRMST